MEVWGKRPVAFTVHATGFCNGRHSVCMSFFVDSANMVDVKPRNVMLYVKIFLWIFMHIIATFNWIQSVASRQGCSQCLLLHSIFFSFSLLHTPFSLRNANNVYLLQLKLGANTLRDLLLLFIINIYNMWLLKKKSCIRIHVKMQNDF